jgi:zinc protease
MKSHRSQIRHRRGLPLNVLSALILLCAGWFAANAQVPTEPRREQLLNGLKILLLNRPGDGNILIKLRVHNGASFDLAGKEGLMRTLAEAMFDQQTRSYITDELNGRIEVTTDYDAISVTLAGRASDFNRLLELVRNAATNPQLTPEAFERARSARLKFLTATSSTPSERADRAVAARLFGTHPYGRTTGGTIESVARIERADLLLVRDRFLHPDNATLVIVGGFDPRSMMRLLRESLGGWTKSDGKVPATFRLPDAPDARTLVINQPGSTAAQLRLALRGLARTDRDAPAALLLASVVRERWLKAVPELKDADVRHEAYRDGGIFRIAATVQTPVVAAKALESARAILRDLATTGPSVVELERAKSEVIRTFSLAPTLPSVNQADESLTNSWLDEQSYNSKSATEHGMVLAASPVTPAEAQRVGARLFLHTPSAAVAVGDAAQLRAELARVGEVEVFGEAAAKPEPAPQTKPQQPSLQLKRP